MEKSADPCTQSELELELRLQQFIELARHGDIDKLLDAIGHARKHLAGDQSSRFGLQAGGLMAYPPDTFVEPYQVRSKRREVCHVLQADQLLTEPILPRTIPLLVNTLCPDTSRSLLSTPNTLTTHCPQCRLERSEDTCMPFPTRIGRDCQHRCTCMSNMFNRAQRACQERSICTPHHECDGRRSRRPTKRARLWPREIAASEREVGHEEGHV